MGTSLTGLTPAATYQGLIKFGDNSAVSASLRYLSDGLGNDLPISVSSTNIGINTTSNFARLTIANTNTSTSEYLLSASTGVASFYVRNDGYLYNAEKARISNILIAQIASNSLHSTQSGTGGGAIYLGAAGTAITNTTALTPTAMAHVKGSGSTSATQSLLVQNSGSTQLFKILDDGGIEAGSAGATQFKIYNTNGLAIARDGSFNANIRIREFSGSGPTFQINGNSTPTFKMIDGSNFGCIQSWAEWTGTGKSTVENASASLQTDSTTRGWLMPRMTQVQILAIASPANALMVYNTDINHICYYDSINGWRKLNHSAM